MTRTLGSTGDRHWSPVAVAIFFVLSVGCGSDDGAGPGADVEGDVITDIGADASMDAGGVDVAPDISEDTLDSGSWTLPEVAWTPCAVITGGDDEGADCATIPLPLDWNEPDGQTIDFFVKRVPPRTATPGPQMWLIAGGPGGTGAGLESLIDVIQSANPEVELFLPDHRGTGRSTNLDLYCDPLPNIAEQFDGLDACIDSIESDLGDGALLHFSTTQAVTDLYHLVEGLRGDSRDTFVYGLSYGTYYTDRYLQLYGDQPDAIILDSFAVPDRPIFFDFDAAHEAMAEQIAELCVADSECATRLGEDPWGYCQDVMQRARDGHCSDLFVEGITVDLLRAVAGLLIRFENTRPFFGPLFHRLDRCDPADVEALTHMVRVLTAQPTEGPPDNVREGTLLGSLIGLSELVWEAPDLAALDALDATYTVSGGVTMNYARAYGSIPTYEVDDALLGEFGSTEAPVLILQAELDAQTPPFMGRAGRDAYAGDRTTYVEVPYSGHAVVVQGQVQDGGPPCGARAMSQFLSSPFGTVDVSDCIAEVSEPSFVSDGPTIFYLFGADDLWDNPVGKPSVPDEWLEWQVVLDPVMGLRRVPAQ